MLQAEILLLMYSPVGKFGAEISVQRKNYIQNHL